MPEVIEWLRANVENHQVLLPDDGNKRWVVGTSIKRDGYQLKLLRNEDGFSVVWESGKGKSRKNSRPSPLDHVGEWRIGKHTAYQDPMGDRDRKAARRRADILAVLDECQIPREVFRELDDRSVVQGPDNDKSGWCFDMPSFDRIKDVAGGEIRVQGPFWAINTVTVAGADGEDQEQVRFIQVNLQMSNEQWHKFSTDFCNAVGIN